jgi:DNA-binding winged helix-turn-helix (wHTH) protein/Tol biopolymer transport system component
MDVIVSKQVYAFAGFTLDAERRLLLRGGETINLHPKAFDLLLALVENSDRVLSKNELLDLVWAEQFVEENNLAVQISTLRKIFGEKKEEHRFIVTVPNKGYRFVAEVRADNRNGRAFLETPESVFEETNFEKAKAGRDKTTEIRRRGFVVPLLVVGIGVLFLIGLLTSRFWQTSKTSDESKQLKLTKLTASGKITNATLSPDGKFAVFAQKESVGESLWLKQIETGSQTRIAAPQPLEYVGLTISPDNRYIYFSVFLNNQSDGWIRRMPLIGGAAQEITGIESGVSVSFAPDGRRFAFTVSSSSAKQTKLMIADTDGANSKTLLRAEDGKRKFPAYKASPAAWSPDGNEIACAVLEKNTDGMKAGILLVNADTASERFILAPRFAWIDNVVWTDAENLAFVASENDEWSNQIWMVSVKTGEARRLTNDLNIYQWLSAAHGNLLTVQQNSISNLRITDFDETLKELKPREILQETDIDYVAFGADDSIYYVSQTSGKREIWRVGKDGANPSQLTTDARISYGFAVSPNDDSIVFTSARESGKHSLWKTDANGRNFQRLTDSDDLAPQISTDGKRIVFQRGLSEIPTVWSLNTENSETAQLTKEHSIKPAISPDGSQVAYYFMDTETDGAWRIGLVSTATGTFIRKLNLLTTVNERRMRWHPSGKFLTFIFSAGEDLALLLLPTDGGTPKIVGGLGKGELNSFDWSRDGKQIVFSKSNKSTDAVLLSDF